jgi:cytochrome c
VAYIKTEGADKAYAEIDNPFGQFVERELYIVVYRLDGTVLAHVAKRGELAKQQPSFWQSYKFMNPVTKKAEPKQMHCERLDEGGSLRGNLPVRSRAALEGKLRASALTIFTAITALVEGGSHPASAQEDPTNIIADQIRAQGYKCDSPQSAQRDPQASRPDEAVWILQRESGGYRVRLVPDLAAKVERINKSQDWSK